MLQRETTLKCLEIKLMNTYLGYFNVYISNDFLQRPRLDAMLKNRLFLLFSQVHQSCSNHGTGNSATNLFRVSLHKVLNFWVQNYVYTLDFRKPRKKSKEGVKIDVKGLFCFLSNIGQLKLTERFSNIRYSFIPNGWIQRQNLAQTNPSKIKNFTPGHIFE